ncbi:MAG: FAD-dependent thymidylate synthase [Acidobacteria bacterium]|nr:FAD-dependent thymidylate synthase [Acidobacteriota bacterium]
MLERLAPQVTLRNYFDLPFDSAIAAARTFYSPSLIEAREITEKQRDSIGKTTFDGGHHTVFQHPHFEFGLENVSRQFVWNFLHNHPFYNSEQTSQRYVRMDQIRVFVPPLEGELLERYAGCIRFQWECYQRLAELLKADTYRILADVWHLQSHPHEKKRAKVERDSEKKAIETARYVIPIAAMTTMVHTISGIVLHRLNRMRNSGDTPCETAQVISEMVERVREVDPAFFDRVGDAPLEQEQIPEFRFQPCDPAYAREFDARLRGRTSRLVDYSPAAESMVADALRLALGRTRETMSDVEAIEWLLDPRRNPYRLDKLDVSFHAPLMKPLHHACYTFIKKISHTADSQDQRHRMVPASRPMMLWTDSRDPDYVTPEIIRHNPAALSLYRRAMERAWETKNYLLDRGVPRQFALYVLPNALCLRLMESSSLLYLMHKWVMRTCLNAQWEIYQASMEELAQVGSVHPRLARHIGPPCSFRSGVAAPVCTEGTHFCGIPVWKLFPHVQRRL